MADKALLFGINSYKQISNLRGCENDVRNMARLLTEQFGFRESQLRQHLSQEVTKQTVADGFEWLLDGARAGDRLVLHFSGHGSNIQRDSGDEPIDELICLYDMDIDNPETYLVDDELGQWMDRVPAGVRMTVVLDTCHSGTGTRRIATGRGAAKSPLLITKDTSRRIEHADSRKLERELTRGSREALETLDEPNLVLARLYEPNTQMQAKRSRSPIRRFGQSLSRVRSTDLNHQLLAAASATQTAADAFINGDYHGAFTYHFCQTARSASSMATLGQIMNAAAISISGAGFSQTPQNEGPHLDERPFGPVEEAAPHGDGGAEELQPAKDGGSQTVEVMPGIDLVQQMLRVTEKFLDLADYLVRQAPARQTLPSRTSRAGAEVVVYVHGIGQHQNDFSLPWWNALQPHLGRSLTRHEVLWSSVVNPRRLDSATRSQAEEDFAEEVELILEDRQRQLQLQAVAAPAGRNGTPASRNAVAWDTLSRNELLQDGTRGSGSSFDDFVRYMLNKAEREEILGIFDSVVRPLLRDGATIQLISHSWGTVVAWEGLKRLDSAALAGRVANLFVVGSALSIAPVRANLRGRFPALGRPTHVGRIFNLDAQGDIVGGSIDAGFGVDQEFLELDTLGCSVSDIGCAHSSYFKANNLQVNRDIFARLING